MKKILIVLAFLLTINTTKAISVNEDVANIILKGCLGEELYSDSGEFLFLDYKLDVISPILNIEGDTVQVSVELIVDYIIETDHDILINYNFVDGNLEYDSTELYFFTLPEFVENKIFDNFQGEIDIQKIDLSKVIYDKTGIECELNLENNQLEFDFSVKEEESETVERELTEFDFTDSELKLVEERVAYVASITSWYSSVLLELRRDEQILEYFDNDTDAIKDYHDISPAIEEYYKNRGLIDEEYVDALTKNEMGNILRTHNVESSISIDLDRYEFTEAYNKGAEAFKDYLSANGIYDYIYKDNLEDIIDALGYTSDEVSSDELVELLLASE